MVDAVGETGFVRRLAALEPAEFRAFVREIYGHRDGTTVVERNGEENETVNRRQRSVYVHHPDEGDLLDLPADIDAVVVPTEDPTIVSDDREVITATDLFRVARYGLDAAVGDGICRRHLGVVPRPAREDAAQAGTQERVEPPREIEGDRAVPTAPARPSSGVRRVVIIGGLLFLGGLVLGVGVGTILAGLPDDNASEPPTAPRVDTPTTPTPSRMTTVTVSRMDATSASPDAAQQLRARYASLEPTCERPPDLVVQLQINALKHDGGTNTGIATVYRFASPENRERTRPFENFAGIVRSDPFAELLDHDRAEYGPILVENRSARQQVTVIDGDDRETYLFRLSKQAEGEYEGCWMTDSVEPRIPGT